MVARHRSFLPSVKGLEPISIRFEGHLVLRSGLTLWQFQTDGAATLAVADRGEDSCAHE